MSKMQTLQQALSASTGKDTKKTTPLATLPLPPASAPRQLTRVGQVNISAWLDPNFKSSLRLVQARKGPNATFQDIMAEALNDLFTKYDVPIVRQD